MNRTPRVLVGTDLSRNAEVALQEAHELATALNGELAVCHVVPDETLVRPLFPQEKAVDAFRASTLRERAVAAVTAQAQELTGREPDSFQVLVSAGTPYAEIVRAAESWGADRIVVGSIGSTGLARMLLGSVALRVARHAHCPVLVARTKAGTGAIVAGTDFSDPALPAVSAAADEARRTGGRVTVVHSLDLQWASVGFNQPEIALSGPDVLRIRVEAEARAAERLGEVLVRCGITGERRVESGPAAAALARVAEELKADLTVVGTAGRSGLRRVLLGSVAETVVQIAPCSVLVVRLHAHSGG